MSHCFFKCHAKNGTDDEQNDCAARCYANVTLLITDGKLNKNVAKRIYSNTAYYEHRWMKLINDSVDECEYDESGVLAENLAKFFECINQNLENNCVDFVNSHECDKVQKHFEKCHNFEPDCKHWPQTLINPEVCCVTPRLFSQNHILSCRRKCSAKELFLQRQLKCVDNCLYNDTKVKENGKFDFTVVQKLLIENSKSQPDWEKSIEDAVEKCEKKMRGCMVFDVKFWKEPDIFLLLEIEESNTQERMKNSYLLSCLIDQMSGNCIEFREDPSCNKVKRYMKHCPDAKPQRERMMQFMRNPWEWKLTLPK